MRKLLTLTLILTLISVGAVGAELGLEQYWEETTMLRLDANYANFAIPLQGDIESFEVGLKIPTTLKDSYLVTKLGFIEGDPNWGFGPFKVGAGYPLELGNWTIRGEFVALSPQWSNVSAWEFQPSLTFGFNFNLLESE